MPPDLLIVAGEHSGDQHAARLLAGLKRLRPDLKVAAVGGRELERAGAQLLFDLTQHSIVGIFEVLSDYSIYRRIFDLTVGWIEEHRPCHVCLVDYPGFNIRLARKLKEIGQNRKGGGEIRVFYYIGPQIWAWKARRRFTMAGSLDALGVIFPFEVDCYKDTDLPVTFVGHPFLVVPELPLKHDAEGPILLLPGSRKIAVSRIFPVMLEAFQRIRSMHTELRALVIFPDEEVFGVVEKILGASRSGRDGVELVHTNGQHSGRAVLTSSGTMSLACGLAGIPGCIAYRAHPFTYLLGRIMTKVRYLGIANLLLNEAVYPEYIQGRATAKNLEAGLETALFSEDSLKNTQESSRRLFGLLSTGEDYAAHVWLHDLMKRGREWGR